MSLPTTALILMMLWLVACGRNEAPDEATKSPLGQVPAAEQRAGDPQAGYEALIHKPYITCGVPYSAYRKSAPPPEPRTLLPERTGRAAELPYSRNFHVTEEGVELVTGSCLSCHAAFFDKRLIIGLGNETMDFTNDPAFAIESLGTYVQDEAEVAEWRKWADIMETVAPYMITDTVGVNPAINLTLALMAHRDPQTLAWSKEPLLEPPPKKPLPVSVPPWWNMDKKNALFYNTEGRGDHARAMMLGAILCADSVEQVEKIDAYAPDIRAYLASIEAPDYPFEIDRALAERGSGLFEQTCSSCHGTYGENWTYPNRVIGIDQIGTDPLLVQAAAEGQIDRFILWFNRSFYGELAQAAPAPGYIAPPLDGVWATAPYLHNGSVPTVEALLNSPKRPTYWTRSFSTAAEDYDQQALGWKYTELPYGKEGARDSSERKKIYDTTLPGYANRGHTFGDHLTEDERKAVLEYLKTL